MFLCSLAKISFYIFPENNKDSSATNSYLIHKKLIQKSLSVLASELHS